MLLKIRYFYRYYIIYNIIVYEVVKNSTEINLNKYANKLVFKLDIDFETGKK